ncbi:hypothetical protein NLI96_g6246 [Meripilus lineatus]|uniref:Uncharacterized protein n=1 Tax=Meripilus lineatus TaxID=2056292 RepID=A0AAD5V392_9APHY|nr:hypothetical protein NLI96_g6246 [Physisporinus lineatus]
MSSSSSTSSSASSSTWSFHPLPATPQCSAPSSPYIPDARSQYPEPTSFLDLSHSSSSIKLERKRTRPLPKVPLRVNTSAPLPPPRKPKSRPLPSVPVRAATLNLPLAMPSAPAPVPTRPLPRPKLPVPAPSRTESQTLQVPVSNEICIPDPPPYIDISPPPSATLSLHFSAPTSPDSPDLPSCPAATLSGSAVPPAPSSITLDIQARTEKTEVEIARRLSDLGFIEVTVVNTDRREKTPPQASQECVVYLDLDAPFADYDAKAEKQNATATPGAAPTKSKRRAKRYSRKWIREKNGKRWVEDNYQDVIHALRLL